MIPPFVTFLIFASLGLYTKSKTFIILAVFSWINLYFDRYTSADDPMLLIQYTHIDFACGLAILYFGDTKKLYQTSMLALMIVAHLLMEISLANDYAWIIESNLYINVIMVLLIMQMLGGVYGRNRISNPLLRHNSHYFRALFAGLPNHKSYHISGEDK